MVLLATEGECGRKGSHGFELVVIGSWKKGWRRWAGRQGWPAMAPTKSTKQTDLSTKQTNRNKK
jgi:hypothetical protein